MPTVTVNGSRLAYDDTGGQGAPVLLIHAFPLRAAMWEQQISQLRDRFRFISPDLKGFGASEAPDDPAAYSMEAYADDLKALLDELRIEKTTVVGLSMGGYVAFALFRQYRDVIGALVLADTRAEEDAPEGKERRSAQQSQVRERGTAELVESLSGALLSPVTQQQKPEVVERAKALMDSPPQGFIGALEAMKNRPDSSGELTQIRVPTLIIVGENDGVTPPEASRKMHESIGGSRLEVLPEAGHLSNMEAPDLFTHALGDFLTEL